MPNPKPLPRELDVDRELVFRTSGDYHYVEVESGFRIGRRFLWSLWNRGLLELENKLPPGSGEGRGWQGTAVVGHRVSEE